MEDKIKKLEEEASKLRKLKEAFPDLEENRDRWKRVRLSAKSANSKTTHIDTHHSCGCCDDAPFLARPYLIYEGEKIYSNPASVCIGEKSTSYYGDIWDEDWQKRLLDIGTPQETVNKLVPSYKKDLNRSNAYDSYQEDLSDIDEV